MLKIQVKPINLNGCHCIQADKDFSEMENAVFTKICTINPLTIKLTSFHYEIVSLNAQK